MVATRCGTVSESSVAARIAGGEQLGQITNSPTAERRKSGAIGIVTRLCAAAGCLLLVLFFVDPDDIAQAMQSLSTPALVAALDLHLLIILILAVRWRLLVGASGSAVSRLVALQATFVATVLNLTLPTGLAGDVGRIWHGKLVGVRIASGSVAAALDRGVGLLALGSIVAVSVMVISSAPGRIVAAIALVTMLMLGLACWRWASRSHAKHPAYRIVTSFRLAFAHRRAMLCAYLLSVVAHLISALIAAVLANGMDMDLAVPDALLFFPVVLLATALPVSIGGWGLRELAAIPVMTLAGLDAGSAVAIAFLFGLMQLSAALLGSLCAVVPQLWRRYA